MTAENEGAPALRCANHPNTETNLKCSRCGKPICVRCVIQTPVGGRCVQCAQLRKPPVLQVGTRLYLVAAAYGLGVALIGGVILSQVGGFFGLSWLLLAILGYGIGEAVSRGANRKMTRGLAVLAGFLTVFAVLAGRAVAIFARLPAGMPVSDRLWAATWISATDLLGNLMGLLFLVLAVVIAMSRVR